MMFNYNRPFGFVSPPSTQAEEDAHKIGLQNFWRQFQPGFSTDPYVVEDFSRPMPFLKGLPLWSQERLGQNVRGPLARFAPGGSGLQYYFGNVQPPVRAFYYDEIIGKPMPMRYNNLWSSFRSELPPLYFG